MDTANTTGEVPWSPIPAEQVNEAGWWWWEEREGVPVVPRLVETNEDGDWFVVGEDDWSIDIADLGGLWQKAIVPAVKGGAG